MAETVKIALEFDAETGNLKRVFNKLEDTAEASGRKAGKEFSDGVREGSRLGFRTLVAGATAAIAAVGAVFAGAAARRFVEAASVQQDAVNELNASLQRIGEFSEANSRDLQNFASDLQNVTTVGDETTLSLLALSQAFGFSAEQSKIATEAAINLAAAAGISLEEATRRVGRTISGSVEDVSKFAPAIKNLSREQLAAGQAAVVLNEALAGAAAAQRNTFSGAATALSNAFGDLQEAIGAVITNSPTVIRIINFVADAFSNLTTRIQNALAGDQIGQLVRNLGLQIQEIAGVIGPIAEVIVRSITFIVQNTVTRIQTVIGVIQAFVNAFGPIFARVFGQLSSIFDGFTGFISQGFNLVVQGVNKVITFIRPVLDGIIGLFQRVARFVGGPELIQAFEDFSTNASAVLNEGIIESGKQFNALFDPLVFEENLLSIGDSLVNFSETALPIADQLTNKFNETTKSIVNTTKATGKQLAGLINNAVVQTTSQGIQALTKSLVLGQEGFKEFGKQIFAILGDLSIKLGETLIFTGIGIESLKALSGAAAIAAGAGLIALGTILKSLGAGPGIGGGLAGGVGGESFATTGIGGTTPDEAIVGQVEERDDPGTQIGLTINGDFFDTDDSRVRLVELLNESFRTDGTVITNASFA